ncbi:N-acetylmuramoyl-L-alanine amidase [Neobacillus driksii]|uniref:N-acetylmuramoyl-L-alanine amidase n=1 Tax=Neobacillus driksii TaxID=3035913 RepID=UPI0035BBEFE3
MYIKKSIFFILFCLVMSSLYSPNLAYSQEFNSDDINAEYVETIERADIFNKDEKIVGEFKPATQLRFDAIKDGKVYFMWDGDLAYIEEKSTKKIGIENLNSVENQEELDTSGDVEILTPAIEQDKTPVEKNTILQKSAPIPAPALAAVENPSISYAAHVQDIGWQNKVSNGKISGTEGQAKRLESIKISIDNVQDLGVKYSTHAEDYGWLGYVSNGEKSGTTGEGKRLEAIKIELTGSKAKNYDIYYRVHAEKYGWMQWVKNGEMAGMSGEAKRLEAIKIMIVEKGSTPPGVDPNNPEEPEKLNPSVIYKTHVQDKGWLQPVSDGKLSGTVGEAKHIEAIQISVENAPYSGGISYNTHVQDYGWMGSVTNGKTSGTTGKNKQAEAIQVSLTGEMAKHYDIYYRVHSESFGWLGWAKNGESAGTEGLAKQLEAIEIVIVEKGGKAPGSIDKPFITKPSVVYSTNVETFGWLDFVSNGAISGTTGKAKHVEAIKIDLKNTLYSGDINYSTHVQDIGWVNTVSNGEISGTTGKGKQMEAIKINLTGDLAKYFDVYYRVHAQDFGWLGWAKNGMKAGSEGLAKPLEAIEIKLVAKGQGATVNAKSAFKQRLTVFLDPGHGGSDPGATVGGYHEADLNFSVAKKVQSLLLKQGYRVFMSRTSDTYVDLIDRPKMANELTADIFVSIHTNSTAEEKTPVNGVESYYYEIDAKYPSKINEDMHNNSERILKSVTLTNLIQENIISYTGASDRGTHGETFAVIREAAMPATLLEMGFINNFSERQNLFKDSYQNKLAKAIADGIDEYFKIQ